MRAVVARMRRTDWEALSDAFLDVVLDKGAVWLLVGIGVVAVFVVVVQIGMAL